MTSLKDNLYLKIGIIVAVVLLLLIPTGMIKSLIKEREQTKDQAINEVSEKWGKEQTITGPFISIPYYHYGNNGNSRHQKKKSFVHILPDELSINGELIPEKRNRGIFEIVVYNSLVSIKGVFDSIDYESLEISEKDLLLNQARISFGISDLRGIQDQVELQWSDKKLNFKSGLFNSQIISSGISSPITLNVEDKKKIEFNFDIGLKGSQKLYFVPMGKTTDVKLHSKWKDPSFNGSFLPDDKSVSESGFEANWRVLDLNRNFPQIWKGKQYRPQNTSFGVDLILPVDNYQKSMRSIKYALMFISFTFIVFFFVEVSNKINIHPIQYALVGLALVIFYTLLLSLSEHLKFNIAFTLSATSVISLIGFYTRSILRSKSLALLIGSILIILYLFIFITIQMQDYALLMGSIGIFIILGLVMFFSRKIDWYSIGSK